MFSIKKSQIDTASNREISPNLPKWKFSENERQIVCPLKMSSPGD